MKKTAFTLLALSCLDLYANATQFLTGSTYVNGAELGQVKETEFILGVTGMALNAKFRGTQLNLNTGTQDYGHSSSKTTSLLPYGRIAKRYNDMVVFGVDVTQPFHSNLHWGANQVTRYAAVQVYLSDIDISPKMAVNVSEKLSIAAGINLNFLQNNEINWAMPTGPGPSQYATMTNKPASYGTGFNVAFNAMLTQQDIFGMAYYSKINQRGRGYSRLGPLLSSSFINNFILPATTELNYTHIFGPKWLTHWQLFHTQWEANQTAPLYNTANPMPSNFIFSLKYKASNAIMGLVRHQYNEKVGLGLVGVIDAGPERENLRPISFPSDTRYLLGIIADYKVNKTTTIEMLYGQGYSGTKLQNSLNIRGQTIPFTTGPVHINANIVDFKVKIKR